MQNHKRTSFATKQSKIGDENIVIYKRLIESAYLFSQSESDEDKNLAQSIAYHLNVVTGDDYLKQMSENLLRVLGNFLEQLIFNKKMDLYQKVLCLLKKIFHRK